MFNIIEKPKQQDIDFYGDGLPGITYWGVFPIFGRLNFKFGYKPVRGLLLRPVIVSIPVKISSGSKTFDMSDRSEFSPDL